MSKGPTFPLFRIVAVLFMLTIVGALCLAFGLSYNLIVTLSFIPAIIFGYLGLTLMVIAVVIRALALMEIRSKIRIGHLVTSGIYSRTRNPTYLSFVLFILGIAIYFNTLVGYAWVLISCISFYLVAKAEEKDLERAFGKDYARYKKRVPLFLGRSHRSIDKND
jgi:protein-S-isoprenylcysteine O-methyltransferase Ste14